VGPTGIALDVAGGKMYWIDNHAEKLQRADLGGSGIEDVVTGVFAAGIALDPAGGKIYWGTYVGLAKIHRANLDGSEIEAVVTTGLSWLWDIELDITGGKMYWSNFSDDTIRRANLDGSDIETLPIAMVVLPTGIALDAIIPGDMNRDGIVNLNDLPLFVTVLLGLDPAHTASADMNGDGEADGRDIQPFIELVLFVLDETSPMPNPMEWELEPAPVSLSELTMTAVEAIDDASPPVEYFFLYLPGDGSGGSSSGWQTPRTYVDDGLDTNTAYKYKVAARDAVGNMGDYSFPAAAGATDIETPTGISFDNVDDTSMDATAEGTFTNLTGDQSGQPPNQSGIFFEMTPDHGSGANVWVTTETISVTGLTLDTEYTFNVRARNYFAVETEAFGPVSQSTTGGVACPLMGDVNQDGGVNGADIPGYVRAQLGQDPLPGENPACADYPVADFVNDLLAT
jgi:hypothetical protein